MTNPTITVASELYTIHAACTGMEPLPDPTGEGPAEPISVDISYAPHVVIVAVRCAGRPRVYRHYGVGQVDRQEVQPLDALPDALRTFVDAHDPWVRRADGGVTGRRATGVTV